MNYTLILIAHTAPKPCAEPKLLVNQLHSKHEIEILALNQWKHNFILFIIKYI